MIKAAIVSPSNFLPNNDCIEKGLEYLKTLGIEPIMGEHAFNRHRYMAGTGEERALDVMEAFKNPEIELIICSSGGAGSQFMLDKLDYDVIRKNPKPVVGFSDNTALQLALNQLAGTIGYTGFSLKFDFRNGNINPLVDETFRKLLNKQTFIAQGGESIIKGKAEGVLTGGCLSLIRNLCGSEYFPDLEGKILLIEDVGEYTYKLDLMLQQVKMSKGFDKLKGIIFGEFVKCEPQDEADGTMDEVIADFVEGLEIPVIKNFPYGHGASRYVLPIGGKVSLDADKRELAVLEH